MNLIIDTQMFIYIFGCLIFLVLSWFAFYPNTFSKSNYDKRIKRVRGDISIQQKLQKSTSSINIRVDQEKLIIDKILKKIIPNTDLLKMRLMRTGKNLSLSHFFLSWLIFGIFYGLIAHFEFKVSPLISSLSGFAMGLLMTNFIINFLIARRLKKFITSLPDAIDLMVRGIKSGLPIGKTIQSVGLEIEGPVGEEFKKVSDAMKIGTDLNDALWSRAKKLDIPELKFLCIALTIQKETGGNLSETLGNLSKILRKRKQMKLKIKAMSSEAKASAIIIGSLPFVMYLILKLLNPEYIEPLLNDPRGIKLVMGGLTMIATGSFIMSKMVRFEI